VGAPTTVSVNNNLATSQTGIAVRTSDNEAARRVEVIDSVLGEVLSRDNWLDHVFHEISTNLLVGDVVVVLSANDNGVDSKRDHGAVGALVFHHDLGLAIRAHPLEDTIFAHLGEAVAELSGEPVSEGHQLGGLVRGVAEHVALITGADFLDGLADVHTLRNIGALSLDGNNDVASAVVNALALSS